MHILRMCTEVHVIYVYILTQKFMFYVLKSSVILDILVPVLYFLNDARADQCKSCIALLFCALRHFIWE